jgi:hypothetical protein
VRVDCFEVNQVERGGRNIDKLIKLLNYFFSWPIYQIKQNAAATAAAAAAPTAAAAAPTRCHFCCCHPLGENSKKITS